MKISQLDISILYFYDFTKVAPPQNVSFSCSFQIHISAKKSVLKKRKKMDVIKENCKLHFSNNAFYWVNVKVSLYLIKHHAMKTYEGVEVQLQSFLTLAPDAGKQSASCSNCFTPGKKSLVSNAW
jgi:hypothetical protein